MTESLAPGIYMENAQSVAPAIAAAPTDVAGFIGFAAHGPYRAKPVTSFADFQRLYGASAPQVCGFLRFAVEGFFANGGRKAYIARVGGGSTTPITAATFIGNRRAKPFRRRGLAALADIDEIAMLVLPDMMHPRVPLRSRRAIRAAAVSQCEARGDRVVILDAPEDARDLVEGDPAILSLDSGYATVYGPWLNLATAKGAVMALPPCGHVAGIYARNDSQRGVWAAPAGAHADLRGSDGLRLHLTEREVESLSDAGVNTIRDFTDAGRGVLVWGARTRSADPVWKYVNVRRLAIFIEKSIAQGLQWVAFEPNREALWTTVRARLENFLLAQWRSGALQGTKPEQAFFVRCDRTTMTQEDIDNGRLVCQIGIAPVRPAEFVLIRIGLWTAKKPD